MYCDGEAALHRCRCESQNGCHVQRQCLAKKLQQCWSLERCIITVTAVVAALYLPSSPFEVAERMEDCRGVVGWGAFAYPQPPSLRSSPPPEAAVLRLSRATPLAPMPAGASCLPPTAAAAASMAASPPLGSLLACRMSSLRRPCRIRLDSCPGSLLPDGDSCGCSYCQRPDVWFELVQSTVCMHLQLRQCALDRGSGTTWGVLP